MENPRDDDATERIDEAFSRGDEGKPEHDKPVMEPEPDMGEEAKEGDEAEEKEPSLEEQESESKP